MGSLSAIEEGAGDLFRRGLPVTRPRLEFAQAVAGLRGDQPDMLPAGGEVRRPFQHPALLFRRDVVERIGGAIPLADESGRMDAQRHRRAPLLGVHVHGDQPATRAVHTQLAKDIADRFAPGVNAPAPD